jgi:hypothetical protein
MSKPSLSERDTLEIPLNVQGDIVSIPHAVNKSSFYASPYFLKSAAWSAFLVAWIGIFSYGCHIYFSGLVIALWPITMIVFGLTCYWCDRKNTQTSISQTDKAGMFAFFLFSSLATCISSDIINDNKSLGFGLEIPKQITWQAGTHMEMAPIQDSHNRTVTRIFGDRNRTTAGQSDMMIADAVDSKLIGMYCPMTPDTLSRWPGEHKTYDAQGHIALTEHGVVHSGNLAGWHMVDVATTGSAQGLLCGASKLLISDLAIHELNFVATTAVVSPSTAEIQHQGLLEVNRAETNLDPQ